MFDATHNLFKDPESSRWVRLRTLIILRWFAVSGQIAAISVAYLYFDLRLELGLCFLVIGASVIANLVSVFVFPENRRLSESEAIGLILFDILQLAALLFLTGGLNNPFALLLLAPVTISATVLTLRATLFLGAISLLAATGLAFWHLPLQTFSGFEHRMPNVLLFGFWIAISVGVVFLAFYARRVTIEMQTMSEALLATQMALAREQKLTDLGGVVAAAAHELGTPLATIKLVSSELMEELTTQPDLLEDAELIRDQADRCRDILQSMGRAGKDDLHLKRGPLLAVVKEAADPHIDRGKTVHFAHGPIDDAMQKQPSIYRRPEVVHGLRNLVQNAVDFAETKVWVDARWTNEEIIVRIADDGSGYPSHIFGRIGDPFVRRRRNRTEGSRPEYEGMGLGLFIAKTLLERSGAEITFANGSDPYEQHPSPSEQTGAIVEVAWPFEKIVAEAGVIGENQNFSA